MFRALLCICCGLLVCCQREAVFLSYVEEPGCSYEVAVDQAALSSVYDLSSPLYLNWWERYQDPCLTACVVRALEANPTIEKAEARLYLACAERKIAASSLFPQIGLQGDLTEERQSKTGIFAPPPGSPPFVPLRYRQDEFFGTLQYDFDLFGKHREELCAAVGEVQAARAETWTAHVGISAAVVATYFELQTLHLIQALNEKEIALYRELASLTEQKKKGALASQEQVDQAFNQVADARIKWQQTVIVLAEAEHALQALTVSDTPLPIASSLPPLSPFPLPCELTIDLLAHRPDVQAALWRTEAAAHRIQAAKAAFYPDISFAALLGWQTIRPGQLFKLDSGYGQWGPAFHLPLFTGGALAGQEEGEKALYRYAVADYNQITLNAIEEVLDGLKALESFHSQLLLVKEKQRLSHHTLDLVQQRKVSHLSSQIDVNLAQLDTLQKEKEHLEKKLGYLQTEIGLIKALGGGF